MIPRTHPAPSRPRNSYSKNAVCYELVVRPLSFFEYEDEDEFKNT
jgi:hypothetical protein